MSESADANYYEATGEPEGVEMLDYLPVLKKRSLAREQLLKSGNAHCVEQHFLRLRTTCVRQLVELWFGSKNHGLVFDETACKIVLPDVLYSQSPC